MVVVVVVVVVVSCCGWCRCCSNRCFSCSGSCSSGTSICSCSSCCFVAVALDVEVRVIKSVKVVKFRKSSKPYVFDTFDFEMFFAPQRRALFRHFFDI